MVLFALGFVWLVELMQPGRSREGLTRWVARHAMSLFQYNFFPKASSSSLSDSILFYIIFLIFSF